MIAGTAFRFVVDFDEAWARLRGRILRSNSDHDTLVWVRWRCMGGWAIALECPDGLVVVEPQVDAELKIAAKVLLAASTGLHGAFKRQEAAMVVIARELGASELSFRTDRAGWARLLGPHWQRRDDVFWRTV